ncbi:MerR family transcriptional regulator [Sphingomonas oryzagri]
MRIGEASTASGVPERMIRHYEKLGLIPAPTRRASGYRVYGDDDVRRLSFIARARRLGFEMPEIAGFMQTWGSNGHGAAAANWRARIAEKAADLDVLAGGLEG